MSRNVGLRQDVKKLAQLKEMWARGATLREMHEALGISISRIHQIGIKENLGKRRQKGDGK